MIHFNSQRATVSASQTWSALSPFDIQNSLPLSPEVQRTVEASRGAVRSILDRTDHRLLVVVGPCTIHDPVSGLDYARRLKKLADEVSSTLFVVMRVFLEKSLTTTGWKGYVNDPDLDESFNIIKGLTKARSFLHAVNKLGLPVATEAVSPLSLEYYGDMVTWTVIGVHSIESQTHRELASGLPTPVAFKNGTNGSLDHAINAILASKQRHKFVKVDSYGRPCMVQTPGNDYGHLVLRGGGGRPNYDHGSIRKAESAMRMAGLHENLVVDCSHENSYGRPELQASVLANVINQVQAGNRSLVGVMLESNLLAGKQQIPDNRRHLTYGCSITDPCIDWETTETIIRGAARSLNTSLQKRLTRFTSRYLPPI